MTLTSEQSQALQRLVTDGVLDQSQAEAVTRALSPAAASKRSGWLPEAAGYVGGGLMLGGAMLVLGDSWEQMTRTGRSAFLGGVAVALLVAAVLAAGGPGDLLRLSRSATSPRRRVVGALLALVALPATPSIGIALSGEHAPTWAFLSGLGISILVLIIVSTPLAVLVTAGLSIATLVVVLNDFVESVSFDTVAMSVVGLGALWMIVGLLRLAGPRSLVLSIGAAMGIFGGQLIFGNSTEGELRGYVTTLVVALVCAVLYRQLRDLMMLIATVIGVTLAVPEAVYSLTAGRVSGAYIVLIGGMALVAASVVGLRLRRS